VILVPVDEEPAHPCVVMVEVSALLSARFSDRDEGPLVSDNPAQRAHTASFRQHYKMVHIQYNQCMLKNTISTPDKLYCTGKM